MSKVITFSRQFPKYHPKAGQPTFFVEKVWKSLQLQHFDPNQWANENPILMDLFVNPDVMNCNPKHHTVRNGKRWKAGDKFSPRVWSGKPYASKQIIIAPDIEIKRTVSIKSNGPLWWIDNKPVGSDVLSSLAANDGLTLDDFKYWFRFKPFLGQAIIWTDWKLPY